MELLKNLGFSFALGCFLPLLVGGFRFEAMARTVKELKQQELEQKCEQAKKIVERRPSINQDELAISVGYPAWIGEDQRRRRTEKVNKIVQALTLPENPGRIHTSNRMGI